MAPFTPQEFATLRRASHRAAQEGAGGTIWVSDQDAKRVLAYDGAGAAMGAAEAWSLAQPCGSADGRTPVTLRAWAMALEVVQDELSLMTMHRDAWLEIESLGRETWAWLNRPRPGATSVHPPGTFTPDAPGSIFGGRYAGGGLVNPGGRGELVGERSAELFLPRATPDLAGANAPVIDPAGASVASTDASGRGNDD